MERANTAIEPEPQSTEEPRPIPDPIHHGDDDVPAPIDPADEEFEEIIEPEPEEDPSKW